MTMTGELSNFLMDSSDQNVLSNQIAGMSVGTFRSTIRYCYSPNTDTNTNTSTDTRTDTSTDTSTVLIQIQIHIYKYRHKYRHKFQEYLCHTTHYSVFCIFTRTFNLTLQDDFSIMSFAGHNNEKDNNSMITL